MKKIILLIFCALGFISTAATANIDPEEKIDALEREISALKFQIRELKKDNNRLTRMMAHLTTEVEATANPLSCTGRKLVLHRQLDKLQSIGLKDSHPNIINLTKRINNLEQECTNAPDDEEPKSSCHAQILQLEYKQQKIAAASLPANQPGMDILNEALKIVRDACATAETNK